MNPNRPKTEDGVVIGNVTDKYRTGNPLYRWLVTGFARDALGLVDKTGATDIHEVGCGEGELARMLAAPGRTIRCSDFSSQVIEEARRRSAQPENRLAFNVRSIYDLDQTDAAELIVCCEVLEHLEEPERALRILAGLARPWALFSVPREPLWRALNVCRGKYLKDLGNTPGHLNHWTRSGFVRLLEAYFTVLELRSPLPWTMVLCRQKA